MSNGNSGAPPLPVEYRASGLLLHVTSLPSADGIGDLGPTAASWVDRLAQAGQRWWQMLPLGPTGYGNSPYQPVSSFAGNTLLLSADWLIEDRLLEAKDRAHPALAADDVDYDAVIALKQRWSEGAWSRFQSGARSDLLAAFEQFKRDQAHWLDDYALFGVLKTKFGNVHYLEWPQELVQRQPAALDRVRAELAAQIEQARFAQFLVFRQMQRLRAYAREKGVQLIGDMPFFVSPDSSDVWAHPELFLLDEKRRPRFVAGVPPDYFSAQGQLWGNPVYDWERLRQSGYRWWIERLRALLNHFDLIRLDHFRGFVAAWHVPASAPTAQTGGWVPGPGADFLQAVQKELGRLPFIAEDLGMITPEVYALRDQFHLPGMRILQFAFDGHPDNPYLPENYTSNSVVYTGTHDNSTTRGWFEELPAAERETVAKYLKERAVKSTEAARALMELAWSSVAVLAIAPLQDLLNLGREARMNIPGHPEGNWRWRCTGAMLSDPAFEWLRDLTKEAKRAGIVTAADTKKFEFASKR